MVPNPPPSGIQRPDMSKIPLTNRVQAASNRWIPFFIAAVYPELKKDYGIPKPPSVWIAQARADIRSLQTFKRTMQHLRLSPSDFSSNIKGEDGRVTEFNNPFTLARLQREIVWEQIRLMRMGGDGFEGEEMHLLVREKGAFDAEIAREKQMEMRMRMAQGQRMQRVGQWVQGVQTPSQMSLVGSMDWSSGQGMQAPPPVFGQGLSMSAQAPTPRGGFLRPSAAYPPGAGNYQMQRGATYHISPGYPIGRPGAQNEARDLPLQAPIVPQDEQAGSPADSGAWMQRGTSS